MWYGKWAGEKSQNTIFAKIRLTQFYPLFETFCTYLHFLDVPLVPQDVPCYVWPTLEGGTSNLMPSCLHARVSITVCEARLTHLVV